MRETLTKKLGPLPVWAWGAIAVVVTLVLFRAKSTAGGGSSPSSAATDQTGSALGLPAGDGGGSSDQGQSTGISPDVLASLLGPNSSLQEILNRIYGGGTTGAIGTTGGGGTDATSASGAVGTSTLSATPYPSTGDAAPPSTLTPTSPYATATPLPATPGFGGGVISTSAIERAANATITPSALAAIAGIGAAPDTSAIAREQGHNAIGAPVGQAHHPGAQI